MGTDLGIMEGTGSPSTFRPHAFIYSKRKKVADDCYVDEPLSSEHYIPSHFKPNEVFTLT